MGARRAAVWLVGLGLSLGPVLAATAPDGGFSEAGQAVEDGRHDSASSLAEDFTAPEGGSPNLGSDRPSLVVGAESLPASTASPAETPLPELPAAPVVFTSTDVLTGALATRLADPKLAVPPRLSRRDREALAGYYISSRFQAAWIADGGWNLRAKGLIERLKHADEDGLDPADYPIPLLGSGPNTPPDPAELAEAELKLSAAAALYARDARGGRIEPTRISSLITPKLDLPGPEAVLKRLAASADPGTALESYNPAYPGYRALRAKLVELRANRPAQPMVRAPKEPLSPRVASLEAMVPLPRLEGDILANMERWRWLPAEVGRHYIFVNIPEFRLELIDNGRVVHEARVITGRRETPTPIFSGEMEFAVVNPSWYIPPSIMKKEILPGLAADPSYAERHGYEVVRKGDQITVRQPPGERNALGFIKFMFPNQHAVYLHDTPNRNLFSASQRAFSHGCVRVEKPFQLADFVLGRDWPEHRLRKLIGLGERTIRMPEKLPVHLSYFTIVVDAAGEIRTFDDIYGYNRRLRVALGLGA